MDPLLHLLHPITGCKRPCSNKVASFRCCDSIWLPSLYFSNAFAFPEDREIGSTIDTTYDGAVVWESTVHAIYFQVSPQLHRGLLQGLI